MLVLSRQRDEIIVIGDDIEITVVDIRGEKVRLGITAPPHISVHRKEVYEAIKREKLAAQGAGGDGKVKSLAQKPQTPPPPPPAPPPPPPPGDASKPQEGTSPPGAQENERTGSP